MTSGAPERAAEPAGPGGSAAPRRSRGRGSTPPVLWVPALIGLGFLLLPLIALMIRTPWRSLPHLLTGSVVLSALRLSVLTASLATAICLVLGVPIAWLLARGAFPGVRLLRALITVPLVLPPVVGGVALLYALGRRGVVGRYLDQWFGLTLPFSTPAVVIAESFVAMPFLIIAVEGALRGMDRRYEEAAATLGASRWTVFRRITLPLVAPGVVSGAVLCWTRAMGEFGATITFAGNSPGRTQTAPIQVYLLLENDRDSAVALSLVLLALSVIVLVALRGKWLSGLS